jgi:hypothetical protein
LPSGFIRQARLEALAYTLDLNLDLLIKENINNHHYLKKKVGSSVYNTLKKIKHF